MFVLVVSEPRTPDTRSYPLVQMGKLRHGVQLCELEGLCQEFTKAGVPDPLLLRDLWAALSKSHTLLFPFQTLISLRYKRGREPKYLKGPQQLLLVLPLPPGLWSQGK